MKKFFKIFFFLFLLFSRLGYAQSQITAVRGFLNETGEEVIEAIGSENTDEKFEVLDRIFEKNVNTSYMARYCLGRYYKLLNHQEEEKYQALFKRYVVSLYKSYPLQFPKESIRFEILDIKDDGKYIRALVSVTLPLELQTEAFKSVRVMFQLEPNPKGGFLIDDLQIAEVSMLITLKNRLMGMMKEAEEEIEWFLDDLNTLVISNEKNLSI